MNSMYPVPGKRNDSGRDSGDAELSDSLREERALWRYRLDRLLDLGFGFEDAEEMVFALTQAGLDWHYVKEQLLDQGCTLDQAKAIVL